MYRKTFRGLERRNCKKIFFDTFKGHATMQQFPNGHRLYQTENLGKSDKHKVTQPTTIELKLSQFFVFGNVSDNGFLYWSSFTSLVCRDGFIRNTKEIQFIQRYI